MVKVQYTKKKSKGQGKLFLKIFTYKKISLMLISVKTSVLLCGVKNKVKCNMEEELCLPDVLLSLCALFSTLSHPVCFLFLFSLFRSFSLKKVIQIYSSLILFLLLCLKIRIVLIRQSHHQSSHHCFHFSGFCFMNPGWR